jgi:hypothetical protein
MKYIVGYPTNADPGFADVAIRYKEHISEVYFSFGDFPNGRNTVAPDGELPFERQARQIEALGKMSAAGLKFNLLFNGNCYGKDSQSRSFFNKIGDTTDYIQRTFGLNSVTTSSPLIAKFIHENFEGVDVRASVNMEIGTPEGMSYVENVFDSLYLKREYNRDAKALIRMREWCDSNGKQMYLLANSGCLNFCSAHTFHDNLVSHEAEIAGMDNGYEFRGVCWDYLSSDAGRADWLSRTNFIRPEDIEIYEDIVPAVKLATRVNTSPERVIRAYIDGKYRGSVMDLLEPNHSGAFYPSIVDNSEIPHDFAKTVLDCDKRCETCGKCRQIMQNATKTINIETFKI